MKYRNYQFTQLADLVTPLGIFLKVREKYSEVLLLESSDYSSKEDSQSFICFDSIGQIVLDKHQLAINKKAIEYDNIVDEIDKFLKAHQCDNASEIDGLFGFTSFDLSSEFENLNLNPNIEEDIPLMRYDFFRFVIEIDHFRNQLRVVEHCPIGEDSQLDAVIGLLENLDYQSYKFKLVGDVSSNLKDSEYKDMVTKAKAHCQRGDVFQMVLSRRYEQKFEGDDLNVYRALRSINPSPYLFYFDYASFRIFGSSPEAQLKVNKGEAEIHPIAGTFKRTGNSETDKERAEALLNDPKESAEHIMLVDLARNDLSKNCKEVEVQSFKKVQYFSHVIHLVSIVTGKLKSNISAYQIFADTFPAGTLSGAPKRKALELIQNYEPTARGLYGGGIGMLGFNGDLNHAIIIRSFVSKNKTLRFQAGAGLVISSDEQKELEEVNNKLGALKQALKNAEQI